MGCAKESALTPKADVREPMSAFRPIPPASPPGADVPGGAAVGPLMTLSGHWQRHDLADVAHTSNPALRQPIIQVWAGLQRSDPYHA